jgi:two-component system, OmpR family, response regulator
VRVLLVEDSVQRRRSVRAALRKSGLTVDTARDGATGLWMAGSVGYDVILLDSQLPGFGGPALLSMLRKVGKPAHVLLLATTDTVKDGVEGLQAGSDEQLLQPCTIEELVARVHGAVSAETRPTHTVADRRFH